MYNQIEIVHTAFIALGSNLEPRFEYLRAGAEALARLSRSPLRVSRVYQTDPVGYTDQPRFLNCVARIDTELGPRALLQELHQIETTCKRTRSIRYGPRTLDLDILLYDNEYICFQDLQIPHARMWERAFVMVPLADLVPERRGLGGQTIAQLARMCRRGEWVEDVGCLWPKA